MVADRGVKRWDYLDGAGGMIELLGEASGRSTRRKLW